MLYIAFWHSVTQCLTTFNIEYQAENRRRSGHLVHVYIEEVKLLVAGGGFYIRTDMRRGGIAHSSSWIEEVVT